MDVKTTFLHGDLNEEIYMKQPKHFVVKGKREPVCVTAEIHIRTILMILKMKTLVLG